MNTDPYSEQSKDNLDISRHALTSPIKLWTPTTIGVLTFFFMFPSGILLASINWLRMGLSRKAVYHLLVGFFGTIAFVMMLPFIPGNRARGLVYLVNFGIAYYLSQQIKKDIGNINQANQEIQDIHWFKGFLISLLMYGFYVILVFVVLIIFDTLGISTVE